MADDNKRTNINVSADIDPAKASINELIGLVDSAQRKIDRAFKTVQDNNNTISNKQLAGTQNGIGRLNDIQNTLSQELDQARATQTGPQLNQSESQIGSRLSMLTQAINQLNQSNQGKLHTINNARTTSSRAFRESRINIPGHGTIDFGRRNNEYMSQANTSRSDIHNINNSLRHELNNLNQGINSRYISYNRMQQYQASATTMRRRIREEQNNFTKPNTVYSQFHQSYQRLRSQASQAQQVAAGPNATSKQVAYARALDEQVKAMDRINQRYDQQKQELDRANEALNNFDRRIGNAQNNNQVTIGPNPNSAKGILQQRMPSIMRGAVAAGLGTVTAFNLRGSNLRLASFDNIKSTAYANNESDNRVLNRLGDTGYRYGYSGADMSQFANAYTGTTGNVGSDRTVDRAAATWARQSRITGGTEQSTLALEQAAGNSADLSGRQMASVGNAITNAITSSGMTAKAAEQQQGLAMLYQNGAAYGMNANDERQMAGMQASLSRYGSQFQGTLGAQTMMQLTRGLGNYNNPGMRQLFANGNPRYTGVNGSARLMEDMQNMNKNPRAMSRILRTAEQSFGGNRLQAAAYLSEQTGVPIDTLRKLMRANDNGALSQRQINRYLHNNRTARHNQQGYNHSGASTVQKNEAALANSAMKASQALDGFRSVLAKATQMGGGWSGLLGGIGGTLGSGIINGVGSVWGKKLGNWWSRRHTGGGRHGGGTSSGDLIDNAMNNLPGGGGGYSGRHTEGGRHAETRTSREESRVERSRETGPRERYRERLHGRGGRFSRVLNGARDVYQATRHNGIRNTTRDLRHRAGRRLAEHEASRMARTTGRHVAESGVRNLARRGGKAALKAVPVLGNIANIGFAASDALHGDWGNTALDIAGFIPGVSDFTDAAQMAGAGDLADKGIHDLEHRRVHGREPRTREELRRSKRGSFSLRGLRKDGGRWLGLALPGIGLGLAGAGLMDYFGNKAHASTNRTGDTQEAWKILRAYNKMLDHAMRVVQAAKSIKAGGDSSSKSGGDISGTGGKGDQAIRSIAKAVAKKTGLDAKNIYAQLALESADGNSHEATIDNNYGGIKFANQPGATRGNRSPEGDAYAHFKDTDAFANAYAGILERDGLHGGMSTTDWANALRAKNYFTASAASYAAQMDTWAKKYASGGIHNVNASQPIRYHAAGGPLITDTATTNNGTDVFGEAGTEAYVPLNAGHYNDGLSTMQQLAGMFGKQLVDQSQLTEQHNQTINPSYNINLTIQGGTDDAQGLAQTVADKVKSMLQQYDNQQLNNNRQTYFANETSGMFI